MERKRCFLPIGMILFFLVMMSILIPCNMVSASEVKNVSVQIPVYCVGENTSEQFVYVIYSQDMQHQVIQTDTLQLHDGENGMFVIKYDYPGAYHYEVSQKIGNDANTTYDDTVYSVDVYVFENTDGSMYAEPVVYLKGDSDKKDGLHFMNVKEQQIVTPTNNPVDESVSDTPQTGDSIQVLYLMAGVFVSGFIIILMAIRMFKGRRHGYEDKDES